MNVWNMQLNKICTNIEQSKKLLKLGLDINTADMYWYYDITPKQFYDTPWVMDEEFKPELDMPAWSLSALFALLPKHYHLAKESGGYFYCYHVHNKESNGFDTPLESVFNTILELIEHRKL